MSKTVEDAESKVRRRLRDIDAALADLSINRLGYRTAHEAVMDQTAFGIYRNRLAILMLSIYHLRDDVRGLARAKGFDKNYVDSFSSKSKAVNLCIKAGDTYKHGVGGRDKNNTVMEYSVLIAHQQGSTPSPQDHLVNHVFLVVDESGEPHQSDLLAMEAIKDWLKFLSTEMAMDVSSWEAKWESRALAEGQSLYKGPIPPELLKLMKQTAASRNPA